MVTVGCAMIVRDAESTIDRVLSSVRPHVDQLCILDTGSVDATPAIAAKYADTLASSQWNDHFGQMRDRAFALCSTDWVLWLDADDELYGGEHLRELAEGGADQLGAYLMRYVTDRDSRGNPTMQFWRERLLRAGRYKWCGRIHEYLEPLGEAPYLRTEDTWVLHHGHGDGNESLQRNIRLLRMALADDPSDPRTLFYLGRDLVVTGAYEEGREILQRYVPLSTWSDERFIAQELIGGSHRMQGQFREAYVEDIKLLAVKPLWPQVYFNLAQDCYFLGLWAESHHFSTIGQSCDYPDSNLFVNPEFLKAGWMIYEAVALYHIGQTEAAGQLTALALEHLPDDPQHRHNLGFFAAEVQRQRDASAPPAPREA
jgi:tetratricopeptide (TPR) repeat protein